MSNHLFKIMQIVRDKNLKFPVLINLKQPLNNLDSVKLISSSLDTIDVFIREVKYF